VLNVRRLGDFCGRTEKWGIAERVRAGAVPITFYKYTTKVKTHQGRDSKELIVSLTEIAGRRLRKNRTGNKNGSATKKGAVPYWKSKKGLKAEWLDG
jgi:hypothetical protein